MTNRHHQAAKDLAFALKRTIIERDGLLTALRAINDIAGLENNEHNGARLMAIAQTAIAAIAKATP